MARDLDELLDRVCNEQSFIAFVAALGEDFAEERVIEKTQPSSPYGPGALGWENGTVDAVLEAASAWGGSTIGNKELNPPGQNPWQRCARILYAGKFYE